MFKLTTSFTYLIFFGSHIHKYNKKNPLRKLMLTQRVNQNSTLESIINIHKKIQSVKKLV